MRATLLILASFVLIYLGICAMLFARQRAMIYYPTGGTVDGPTLALKVDDAELRVSVRPRDGPKALVYFGGNAEDVSFSLPSLADAFPGHALYLMHYRGYGGSSGAPSEKALHRDADALFDLVHARHPQVVVVGRSLGSGVAIRVASRRPAARLILITPFDSIAELAASQFRYFPVRWLLTEKFESWRHAPAIRIPTTLIAAERDEIIPFDSTARLHAAFAPGVAALSVIPGAGHNTISEFPAYQAALRGSD